MNEMPITAMPSADSMMLEPARAFEMPSSRVRSLGSGSALIAVLLCLMLGSAALLAWFAVVPRDDANASSVTPVVQADETQQDAPAYQSGTTLVKYPLRSA